MIVTAPNVCLVILCMYLGIFNGAKRCGGVRCEAMRCGAAKTKRSDDDEEKRGNLHWQAPTRSKSVYHSTNVSLSSTILRRNFRPVSISGYLTCCLITV